MTLTTSRGVALVCRFAPPAAPPCFATCSGLASGGRWGTPVARRGLRRWHGGWEAHATDVPEQDTVQRLEEVAQRMGGPRRRCAGIGYSANGFEAQRVQHPHSISVRREFRAGVADAPDVGAQGRRVFKAGVLDVCAREERSVQLFTVRTFRKHDGEQAIAQARAAAGGKT
eukprot:scaffold97249_cov26-Tisochrysis_lutea.AAC.1